MSSKSCKAIVAATAKSFAVSATEIMAKTRRNAATAQARQVAMFVYHESNATTVAATADVFGRQSPAVSHALRVTKQRMKNSKKLRQQVQKLMRAA